MVFELIMNKFSINICIVDNLNIIIIILKIVKNFDIHKEQLIICSVTFNMRFVRNYS